jgi:hypothetical protein
MQVVRNWLLLVAVTLVVALCGFATPTLAHGGHSAVPAEQATHTPKANLHDVADVKASVAEAAGQMQQDDASDTLCCGLSCMMAVPQYDPQLLIVELQQSSFLPPLHPELRGRGPARLDRPPTT